MLNYVHLVIIHAKIVLDLHLRNALLVTPTTTEFIIQSVVLAIAYPIIKRTLIILCVIHAALIAKHAIILLSLIAYHVMMWLQ